MKPITFNKQNKLTRLPVKTPELNCRNWLLLSVTSKFTLDKIQPNRNDDDFV